jgi:uncharacterized protein
MRFYKFYFILSFLSVFSFGCKKTKKEKVVDPANGKNSNLKSKVSKNSIKPSQKVKVDIPIDSSGKAKVLVNLLVKKEFKKIIGMFSPELKKVLPIPKLASAWQSILKVTGNFKKIIDVKKVKRGTFQIFSVSTLFEKSKWTIKVVFNKKGQVISFTAAPSVLPWRVPSYADNKKFSELETKVGKGEWELPGTITIPKGNGPFPLIIFVHGSGPNDRDETILSNKVFKDIAWGLASKGVASIRYDKRTLVHGKKMAPEKTDLMVEAVDDVVIAFKQFSKDKRFDSNKIFILGHSLGGYAMPLIAKHIPKAGGFIMMAGSSLPLGQKIIDQIKYLTSLEKTLDDRTKGIIKEEEHRAKIVLSDKLNMKTPAKDLPFGKGHPAYWLFLKKYDHLKLATQITAPLLVLQGGRDYQVTFKGDFALWKKTLSNKKNAKFILYPTLSHLFIYGRGTPSNKEYSIPGNVDLKVITDIIKFVDSEK